MGFRGRLTRISELAADLISGAVIRSADPPAARVELREHESGLGPVIEFITAAGTIAGQLALNNPASPLGLLRYIGRGGAGLAAEMWLTETRVDFFCQEMDWTFVQAFDAPKTFKTGTKSTGAMVAGVDKTVNVSFGGFNFPDTQYQVFLTIREPTNNYNKSVCVTNKLTTGFDIVAHRTGGTTAIDVDWLAARVAS